MVRFFRTIEPLIHFRKGVVFLISFIVPFYKSKATVRLLYEKLCALSPLLRGEPLEFVFVEDCGEDGSWEILQEIAQTDSRVKAIQFSRNFGQHYAITAGLDLCSGDWAVVMDCDLQDRPEEIPRLYEKALEGYDVVFSRRGKRMHSFGKKLASKSFWFALNWLSGMKLDPEIGSLTVFSRKVVDAYCSMRESLRCLGGHLAWLGFSTAYIDVEHAERHSGKSSYSLKKLFSLATNIIVVYSDRPLRFSINAGFLMAFLSFCFASLLTYRKLVLGIPVDGWTSIMVSMWFLGGLIIANLGIIGIYLGKVFDEAKKRPLYVISKRINV